MDIVTAVSRRVRAEVDSGTPHCVYVLGTRKTFEHALYEHDLAEEGVNTCALAEGQRERVYDSILAVKAGRVEEGGNLLRGVVDELVRDTPAGVSVHLVLGCTELPLAAAAAGLLPEPVGAVTQARGVTWYDSLGVLVDAVVGSARAPR